MKKIFAFILMLLSFSLIACEKEDTPDDNTNETPDTGDTGNNETPEPEPEVKKQGLGFATGHIGDFTQYENTAAYVKVTTAQELLDALAKAKYDYTNNWYFEGRDDAEKVLAEEFKVLAEKVSNNTATKEEKNRRTELEKQFFAAQAPIKVDQVLKTAGTVHVIEIMNDLDLGYNVLTEAGCDLSLVNNFTSKADIGDRQMSNMYNTYGMSQIKIEQTSNLMIFSKNGAKLTHCGFKISKCDNLVIRNLEFDEIWQWEDSAKETPNFKVCDYDGIKWAYMKIHSCGYIWIDSCTFGKAYDGLIDIAHPTSPLTSRWAPYGNTDENGVHISNCKFMAGSDDKEGYIYKMMEEIEADYQNNGGKYLYYKTLRDMGATFEEILYGIAIPQKKGFLLADEGDNYEYNLELKVSFDRCYFKNIQDRVPKIRGGIAYMSNCIADATQFMEYRTMIKNKGIDNTKVASKNPKYKLALVSQGILCGLGGEFMAENCKFLGIESILKNNDDAPEANKFFYGVPEGKTLGELQNGSYSLNNVLFKTNTKPEYTGSSNKINMFDKDFNATKDDLLQIAAIDWRNSDGKKPFTPELIHLNLLQKDLLEDNPIGVKTNFEYNNY